MASGPSQTGVSQKAQSVLLLRWVLIIATSYLVLFSRPLAATPPSVALFVAAYFASNLVLRVLLPRMSSQFFDISVVVLDVVMVSTGLVLMAGASSQFFVVYFLVLFVSALTERIGLVVAAALLVSAAHLYTMSQFVGVAHLIDRGYTLRIPFLFAVALFFGNLVGDARRRERDAEEAYARKQRMEFLSTVSHDLKNSLGVIRSLAILLLEGDAGPLNEEQTELARRLHASAQHVMTFAFNLIDAERIEAGRLVLQRRPASLAEVVEDALLLARSASELKGVVLNWSVEPDLPPLHIDAVQMERVISNLVGNAIKFTPPGGTVTLSARRVADQVVVEVHDTGAGITLKELPAIFEKYRRQMRSGRVEGSGLGLFIVKAIVEAHGGNVGIRSTVGQGTAVKVQLPLAASDSEPALNPKPRLHRGWPRVAAASPSRSRG